MTDALSYSALMAAPLNIHPEEFEFDDYKNLISVCYEIRGAPGQIANLVSTRCTSINAKYVRLGDNPAETTFGSVGIRAVDENGECNNIGTALFATTDRLLIHLTSPPVMYPLKYSPVMSM